MKKPSRFSVCGAWIGISLVGGESGVKGRWRMTSAYLFVEELSVRVFDLDLIATTF